MAVIGLDVESLRCLNGVGSHYPACGLRVFLTKNLAVRRTHEGVSVVIEIRYAAYYLNSLQTGHRFVLGYRITGAAICAFSCTPNQEHM